MFLEICRLESNINPWFVTMSPLTILFEQYPVHLIDPHCEHQQVYEQWHQNPLDPTCTFQIQLSPCHNKYVTVCGEISFLLAL
ncbi:hypothetical protein EYC80_008797 [Monilinia laxa]|uniref:Uncharacterized protein n=1 Tax=Monilinia laxa TaxID=61186 RepID=A0A5N6K1E8_MONLA|nr:hypothetical protein EYC80_008797 [Monilinia laxa]